MENDASLRVLVWQSGGKKLEVGASSAAGAISSGSREIVSDEGATLVL